MKTMLPIKRKNYNLLTEQFEDENSFNLLPTTSYPAFISETNEHDVGIERIKVRSEKEITKINRKYDLEIAEKYENISLINSATQSFINDIKDNPCSKGVESELIEPGFFFPKRKKCRIKRL